MKPKSKSTLSWKDVVWSKVHKRVFRYQQRIYSASLRNQTEKVKYLQRKLIRSFDAKLWAVRRVTSDNKGKRTPGIDKHVAETHDEKMALVRKLNLDGKAPKTIRRVWIAKPGKDELRPLGIPTLKDRAKQTYVVLALSPQWEAKFEPNSYGFRPGRCAQDAMIRIFLNLRVQKKTKVTEGKWALDADIAGCFDNIDHDYLLKQLQTLPQIKKQIHAWLKAGVMTGFQENKPNVVYENRGTPQGGPLSPLLSNIALHGLENHLKQWVENQNLKHIVVGKDRRAKRNSLGVVRYADDFVVLHKDRNVIKAAQTEAVFWLVCQNFQAKSK